MVDVPKELLYLTGDNSVNILIGENGSGKSTLLRKICDFDRYSTYKTVGIANTIYDKFPSNRNLDLLKISVGKSVANKVIAKTLVMLADDEFKSSRNVARVLEYVNYIPKIRFELKPRDLDYSDQAIKLDLDRQVQLDVMRTVEAIHEHYSRERYIDVNLYMDSFSDIKNSVIFQYFKLEKVLRKLAIWRSPKVSLFKAGSTIPLQQASSGELTLITSLMYLSAVIEPHSTILIDEPENSLHPKWQTEYVKNLMELFYRYEPSIVIATHSPLILNGAEIEHDKVRVFKGRDGNFTLHENSSTNVEEIYQDFFNVTTPENRFVSEEIVQKMNELNEGQISKLDFDSFIRQLIVNSYDQKQVTALEGILELSNDVIK